MNRREDLRLEVHIVPYIEAAINERLSARDRLKMRPSKENEYEYNATLFDLGAAWGERYPEASDTPGAFEWYRRGLIAPEEG